MKKLRLASLIVLFLSVILSAGRTLFSLPDWAVRLNGVIMLAACGVLVFTSVRLLKKA